MHADNYVEKPLMQMNGKVRTKLAATLLLRGLSTPCHGVPGLVFLEEECRSNGASVAGFWLDFRIY
jgi:hypothetical protein